MSYKLTEEERHKLIKYIGKEIKIKVHIEEAIWDYGDVERSEYDVDYRMRLEEVGHDRIIGKMAEEKKWKRKNDQIVQRFEIIPKAKDLLPWEAGTFKTIILIQHDNEILYDRRK